MALGAIAMIAGILEASSAAIALGAVLIAGPLAVWISLTRSARRIVLSQIAPESAFEGDEVVVRIALRNGSRSSIFHPRLAEIFSPEFDHQKDVVFPERVAPGEIIEARYRGRCAGTRGRYVIGPTVLRVCDPFGWFELRQFLSSESDFKVYPRIGGARHLDPDAAGVIQTIQEVTRNGPGHGHEPWTVREYAPGDPRKRVHWRASARRGRLMVRVDTRVGAGDATLYIDSSRRFNRGFGREATLEQSVRLVAATAAHLLRTRTRVELKTVAPELCVPLGLGESHLAAILEALVDVRPVDDHDLLDVLDTATAPTGGTVVIPVGSYLFGNARLHQHLMTLSARHAVICVLFEDDDDENLHAATRWIAAAGARVHVMRSPRTDAGDAA